jgi:hypothetical protein
MVEYRVNGSEEPKNKFCSIMRNKSRINAAISLTDEKKKTNNI